MTDETIEIDTKGLYCPEPVMMLHAAVRKANSGELIRVIATDPSTTRDIPKFCQFLGHTLERQEQHGEGEYIFEVRKK